jgi:hypothetical protein
MVLVLAMGALGSGCSSTCDTGEVKVGERCVKAVDAVLEGDAAGVVGDDGDASVDGDAGKDKEAGQSVSEAGSATRPEAGADSAMLDSSLPDAGAVDAAQTLSASEETTTPVDAGAGALPDTGSATIDAGCVGQACVVDVCHPNPCGHGACTLIGSSFSCKCEPDWQAQGGICNVNTNPALRALTVSAGKLFPEFKSSITEYSVDLPLGAPEFSLTPNAAAPDGAALRVDGDLHVSGVATPLQALELNKSTRVSIQVTADNGATRTYAVVLRRTLVLQSTLKSDEVGNIETFGAELVLSGNLLLTSTVLAVGEDVNGPTTAVTAVFARNSDASWRKVESLSSSTGSLALGEKWVVVPSGPNVHVHKREGLGSGRGTLIFNLSPDANEVAFGRAVAIDGDTLLVASDTTLHIFDLQSLGPDDRPSHTRVAATWGAGTAALALEGDTILASRGSKPPVMLQRDASGWNVNLDPFNGQAQDAELASLFDGRVAIAEGYGCLTACLGEKAQLHVFEPGSGGWSHQTSALEIAPAVPLKVDPSGFGLFGFAQGPGVVVVGAPLVRSRRAPVARTADPFVPPEADSPILFPGAAYVFVRKNAGWVAEAILSATEEAVESQPIGMGRAASYSNGRVAVSAAAHGTGFGQADAHSGAIYIFGPDCNQVPAGASVPGC